VGVSDTKKHITLRLHPEALEAADLIAQAEGRSRNDVIRRLISDGLNRRQTMPCRRCGKPRQVNAECPCASSITVTRRSPTFQTDEGMHPAHRMAGGSRGYCADCPDHEACSTGWQCWMVKEIAETTGDLTTEPYEGTA
jgi:hypothetical protein